MADVTIGAHDTIYIIGMLSIDNKDSYSTNEEITLLPLAPTPPVKGAIDPMADNGRPTLPMQEQQYGVIIRALNTPCLSNFKNHETDDDKI
ncbi:hypothetical protein H4S08_004342 [Coemansia sp. RSA 1365]|nr:hypothetical protein H4S08_004342 [Coemansia sp. RSA 1365]